MLAKIGKDMFNNFVLSLILVLALPRDVTKAQNDQPGFISIDCGLQGPNYTNENGLFYVSDVGFVDSGVIRTVSQEYDLVEQQYSTLRYFPEGVRNCYTLRPGQGKAGRYLIRARFVYGNYDGLNQPPTFDVYIGLQYWGTVTIAGDGFTLIYNLEIIHVPSSDYINVCLVKTTPGGIPFITTLELRPIPDDVYKTAEPRGSLNFGFRVDIDVNNTGGFVRFRSDIYDRIWLSFTLSNTLPLNTTRTFKGDDTYKLPSPIMGTAAIPDTSDGRLRLRWTADNDTTKQYLYLHFAEVAVLGANESRTFDIFVNDELWFGNFSPPLNSDTIFSQRGLSGNTSYVVEIVKTANSTLPPLLNAAEMHTLLEFPLQETNEQDVGGMLNIKSYYKITQNWQGDPCGPQGFQWVGVNCSANDDSDRPRITSLNLSSKKLAGIIAPAIAQLNALQQLDLSNNNLSGTVPEFLADLSSLTTLNLKGNNFTQPFPQRLLSKANSGILKLDYDNSTGVDANNKKKKNSVIVPIAAALGGVLFIICASLSAFFILRARNQKETFKMANTVEERRFINDPNSTPLSQISNASPGIISSDNAGFKVIAGKSRQYTYHEVLQITNNFERVIGKGGFGTVYHGYVGDVQVAVKMLSPSSTQGYKEFQAEASLLLTIHHKHLTSLVGYCYEGTNMGILYEYMANGNLEKHLYGNGSYVLSWEERLRMATDAAQGLEYLHHGCKPPVVHRDVKITNILVDDKFRAKLADFGLSRAFPIDEEKTHVSTVVAGTPGYLDPEYYSTMRLTEKSDIYSFGVVLLEIVTGRPALPRSNEMTHIISWVSSELEKGNLSNIVDPAMRGEYAVNSIWKVLEVAMSCVARNSTRRPTMTSVVMELNSCFSMEMTRNETESKDSIGLISSNMESELNPQAR